MNQLEAERFIDQQLKPRWERWSPPPAQMSDWCYALRKLDWESALRAAQDHFRESKLNKPVIKSILALAQQYMPKEEKKTYLPPATHFVQYTGGGDTTLVAGYYFPIYVKASDDVDMVAQDMKETLQHEHGGEWRVYKDISAKEMIMMRFKAAG